MNFIRFTGEAIIYGTLIFCGLIVLAMFTQAMFFAIQIDASWFIQNYLIVYGAAAVAMITVYLVETKKSVVENFAPILAKIFSPLFLFIMLAFLLVLVVSGKSPFMERDYLIAFDFMLVLVLGLVLYTISARNPYAKNKLFDYLNLALIVVAMIIDAVALSAILLRLSAFGITPNKLAALGENLILLINLAVWLGFMAAFSLKKLISPKSKTGRHPISMLMPSGWLLSPLFSRLFLALISHLQLTDSIESMTKKTDQPVRMGWLVSLN